MILFRKQELVFIRSYHDLDVITSFDESRKPKIIIIKLCWNVPHVKVSIAEQLRFNQR